MECGECTLCCKLLETHDIPSERFIYCQHCEPEVGCKIHLTRPEECRKYQCMWLQMENVGMEMRPDQCHIIFDRISDRTICGLKDPDYKLNNLVKGQINAFLKEGFSVIIINKFKKSVYVADGHSMDEAKKDLWQHLHIQKT